MDWATSVALCAGLVCVSVAFQAALSAASGVSADESRQAVHWVRKIQHAGTGLMFVAVIESGFPLRLAALLLWAAAAGFVALHLVRQRVPAVQEAFLRAFAGIMRKHERSQLPGAAYFLVGCAVVTSLLSRPLAVVCILAISLGDPVASAVGILWGPSARRWGAVLPPSPVLSIGGGGSLRFWHEKSLVGAVAGAGVVAGAVLGYFATLAPSPTLPPLASLQHAGVELGGWDALTDFPFEANWATPRGGPITGGLLLLAGVAGVAAALSEAAEVGVGGSGGLLGVLLALVGDDNFRVPLCTASALVATLALL